MNGPPWFRRLALVKVSIKVIREEESPNSQKNPMAEKYNWSKKPHIT